MSPAPIAVFGYRRPRHLRRVVDALAAEPEAGDSELILFLDGSKGAADRKEVAAVRALAGEISGFGSIRIHAAEQNLGLARSISEGVSKVCREHGRAIILEDDVVPVAGFLSFMNEALEKYQEEPQVMQVSGYAYPIEFAPSTHAFLPLTSCWGWATWQRAWESLKWDVAAAQRDLADADFVRRFNLEGAYPYDRLLRDVVEGKSDSWGVIWYWHVFRKHGLTLFPAISLVENIGWDGSGEHAVPTWTNRPVVSRTPGEALWPREVRMDETTLKAIETMLKGKAGHLASGRHRS